MTTTRTHTPKPTNTPRPTNTPTITPSPTDADTIAPSVSGSVPSPGPGYLGDDNCGQIVHVSNIRVTDATPSYGMQWVKLKYQVVGFTGDIFTNPLGLVSGGATPDGGWDATYSGQIQFEIDTAWDSDVDYTAVLSAIARDRGGNEATQSLGSYTIDEDCDGD